MNRRVVVKCIVALSAMFMLSAHADFTLLMRDLTGGSDGNPNTTTEAETIIALAAPDAAYQYTDYTESPDPDTINVADAGSFGSTDLLPDGSASAETYVLRATANMVIPAGDWTIAFGRDDGGYIRIGDGFPGFINEYSTNGDPVSGDSEIRFEGTGGHNWTWGTFTLASPLSTTLDALMFESGGGDSWEIAFASGHKTSFNTTDFSLLEDTVNGWTVQVAPLVDTDPPVIDTLSPADDSTDVNPTTDLVATFSEAIAIVTNGTISIKNLDASTQMDIILPDAQVTVAGTVLTINPTDDLGFGTNYAVRISNDAIEDLWSTPNTFGGITNDTTWNFITAAQDLTAPVITNTAPTNNATGVVPNANLVAEFDDGIVVGSGNITIYNVTDATNVTVIAVTNASQVSIAGNVLTINTGVSLEGAKDFAVLIDAGAVENFSGLAFAGISDTTSWSFSVASLTTYNQTGGDEDWNNAANWDNGVPVGQLTAVIAAGKKAIAKSTLTPAFSGGLTIGSGSELEIQNFAGAENAYGTGTIIFDGGKLDIHRAANVTLPAVDLTANGGTLTAESSAADDDDRNFGSAITGIGQLTVIARNKQYIDFAVSNSFTGGLVFQTADRSAARFKAAGSAGAGDVTVIPRSDGRIVGLIVEANNVFADTATLTMAGIPYKNSNWPNGDFGPALIDINSFANTVGQLVVNGVIYPANVYDSTRSWIRGSGGTLTVLAPSDTTAPVFSSITDDVSGGPIPEVTALVNYTVSFDDYLMDDVTIDASVFSSIGTATVTIGTVTPLSATNFNVVVMIESAGTIQLQINAGADIKDMAGNALDTSSAILDDTIITVTPFTPPPDQTRTAPTLDGTATGKNDGGDISLTFDASGSDKLVVIVTGEHGFPGVPGDCSVITYDGVPLIQAIDRDGLLSAPSAAFDQIYNDIWYLDNPTNTTGAIFADVSTRGVLTAFALSGTAPGVGATAISPQESKSVKLGAASDKSIVIASHGMGGDGNTANVTSVNTVSPLVETSAIANSSWDGHVTGYMPVSAPGLVIPTFTGGYLVGSHTIAAEFPGAVNIAAGTLIMLK